MAITTLIRLIIALIAKNDDLNDPELDADQGQANLQNNSDQQDHEELISSDVFLESIDSSTSITAPKGPPVPANLDTLVNTRFKTELETGQRKQIKAKYLLPENCTDLFWPPVNEHIWNPLKPDIKGADRVLVAMQDTLVTVSGAIATCLNDLLLSRDKTKPVDYKAFSTRLIDVVTLLGSVCRELSYRRKERLSALISMLTSNLPAIVPRSLISFCLETISVKQCKKSKPWTRSCKNSLIRHAGGHSFGVPPKSNKTKLTVSLFYRSEGGPRTLPEGIRDNSPQAIKTKRNP